MAATNPKVQLSSDVVRKIAHLARISSSPSQEFLDQYSKSLSDILGYVEELSELDTTGISPLAGLRTIEIENLAQDEPYADQLQYRQVATNIINQFPIKKDNYLILPGIFDEN